jgi:cell fate (sporulation/competence/biofilm development) regulator YmcA (YheA/YmcA/DUF963 family)
MEILVFKTNITNEEQTREVGRVLDSIPVVEKFNFDLDDCDRILRIISNEPCARFIESLLAGLGIDCKELEDCEEL